MFFRKPVIINVMAFLFCLIQVSLFPQNFSIQYTLEWGTPAPIITPAPIPAQTVAPLTTAISIASPLPSPSDPPTTANDDFLHTDGNNIKDRNNQVVRLTGTNWFGFNNPSYVLDGLWSIDLKTSLQQIATRGFNVLRIPIATELIYDWSQGNYPIPTGINTYQINTYLAGKNSLEVFDIVIATLKSLGMKAIIDVHSVFNLADSYTHPVWYKDWVTTEIFDSSWEWIVNRYKGDDTVIGVDLKNEPHGKFWTDSIVAKWDSSTDLTNWKKAVEDVSARIFAKNPNLLVLVEGVESFPVNGQSWTSTVQSDFYTTWWGGNLRGVASLPINLGTYQNQLAYAPHEYGPNVYEQPWFYAGFSKDTLYNDDWYPNWYYIIPKGSAPVFIGEWGGKLDAGRNEIWMTALRNFIIEKNLHHTYWCFNGNSTDTGGLLLSDWSKWDETKYQFVKPSLWQDSRGKFVGLDHTMPLYSSSTGTTITEYYANNNPAPSTDPVASVTPLAGKLGDVNLDSTITIVDALLVAQYYVGLPTKVFYPEYADVTKDGKIDISDALRIAQCYIGFISCNF
jgi:endoglucanase